MTNTLRERVRTRIPSLPHFLGRARQDWRLALYDLLPIASKPRQRDLLSHAIAWFRPKTRGFKPTPGQRSIHDELRRTGISRALPPLDSGTVAALRQYFERTPCHDPYRPHLGRFPFDAPASPETNMGYFTTAEILAAPGLLALLNDPDVLAVAEFYLGCKPLLDNIGAWWAFGGREAAKGTQRFHRDFDSLRGFKLFIYLTDVDEGSGPHVYMSGSHVNPLLDTGKAQADETIRRLFGAGNEMVVTGAAGTRFIADTFGFHKGALPAQGRRLMVAAQYNVHPSPHTPRPPVLTAPPAGLALDREINRLLLA
ncbi:MAG TPA: hypothetical protein VL574_03090 [Stellaceae bacterium]|nr:hypothetical protein [Stellaceae bacterium]